MKFRGIVFSLIVLLSNALDLHAQQGSAFIELGSNAIAVDDLMIIDSVTQPIGGNRAKLAFYLTFNVPITDASSSIDILNELQVSLSSNKILILKAYLLSNANAGNKGGGTGKATRREYSTAIIRKMLLPAFDASGKTTAYIQVTVEALACEVSEVEEKAIPVSKSGRPVMVSAFRIKIDGLPCDRVSAVSRTNIASNGQVAYIQVSKRDETDWYNAWKADALRGKLYSGRIELLDPAMKVVVATIQLERILLTSFHYDDTITSMNKSKFGIVVSRVSFMMSK